MTCREVSNLLPLFFDGELDARQMRVVALHSSRCGSCEGELRSLERLQELVSERIGSDVDEIDLTTFWPAIEQRLGPARAPLWARVRAWWSDSEHAWLVRLPALAAAAAIVVLALLIFLRAQPTTQPDAPQIAAVDSAASIESVDSDADSVAVLNDPQTRTTVLWVSDDAPVTGDVP